MLDESEFDIGGACGLSEDLEGLEIDCIINKEVFTFNVLVYDNHFVVSLNDNSVVLKDVIEAKVELGCLISEHFDGATGAHTFNNNLNPLWIESFKQMIGMAWSQFGGPRGVEVLIENLKARELSWD